MKATHEELSKLACICGTLDGSADILEILINNRRLERAIDKLKDIHEAVREIKELMNAAERSCGDEVSEN